ncbi:MAG: wax ester/triacylglycerol synthase family O-acyltransferase [Solirubrobacterales bacterium]|nr:wax ester/triacylglycerol synthase family O-acyltransferase [Solirubrobacterales bacterium]
MAQRHRDRLSAIDASFLHQERRSSHMHVGAIVLMDGPPPSREEFTRHIESRLHMVPRYRQKLAFPRFEMGRPFWVDDPRFNIEYHVRHTALPSPGSMEQLRGIAGRIYSQRLDRSKPLWEIWLVQGLADGGYALVSKTHHALVDGVSGVDIATVLFDLDPDAPPREEPPAWVPEQEPSQAELVAEGIKDLMRAPGMLAGEAAKVARDPAGTLDRAREGVEGLGEIAWAGLNPAPDVPLNVDIGPHRRIVWVQCDLADFKAIKNGLGGTVNDAFLAVVAGGLGRWLHSRGVRTEGLELRGLVPVSIRSTDEHHALGNRIAAMRGPLPVYATEPVERLRIVREAMQGVKESKQALGAEVISGLEDFAPPTLLAQASRLNFSTRLFNLIVTNVPGPQFPLYMLGRQMREIVPVAFLPENHALAVAAMSYNGKLDFGLLGDYDAIPDLERMAEFFEESLDELLTAAGKSRRKGGATAPKPRRAAAKQAKATATKSKAAAGKPKSAAATRKAAAQPKTATKRPKAATAAGSNGRPAKRSAIRGKAQRPRLIDSDGD